MLESLHELAEEHLDGLVLLHVEALHGELVHPLVRVGVVQQLQRVLEGDEGPPPEQGVQSPHLHTSPSLLWAPVARPRLLVACVVHGVHDPGQQRGVVQPAVVLQPAEQLLLS